MNANQNQNTKPRFDLYYGSGGSAGPFYSLGEAIIGAVSRLIGSAWRTERVIYVESAAQFYGFKVYREARTDKIKIDLYPVLIPFYEHYKIG